MGVEGDISGVMVVSRRAVNFDYMAAQAPEIIYVTTECSNDK
jgi:hypothetical protein